MIRRLINELQAKGWTKAAIARELKTDYNTLDRWAGGRIPHHQGLIEDKLRELLARKRIPKGKVYTKSR